MKIMTLALGTAALFAAPALAQDAPTLPYCSATVTDSCQQTAAQQARAMSGEQADKRDAANGGVWTPDKRSGAMTASTSTKTKKKKS